MATIKPIESRSIHQIQSGQVIVDLCSVVKELVENSLDAGATNIGSNQGLESIEVQDNGDGITPHNYETVALKHHTSKLSTYSDLTTLQTFGFRGEALSSLCALSHFSIVTCMAADAPKGTKLEFEVSGKLKGTSVVAAQKGTMVTVEDLFNNLPVRRRELERNIKREWSRVTAVLGQYACIQTGIKFSVSQQTAKGKKTTLFSTKGNHSTKENIVNVFGAKTLTALVPLDLNLDLEPTSAPSQRWSTQEDGGTKGIRIIGHISRPAFGEGRQTPDRQMFFVNSRPCGLPQVAKAFNEVYKSYNSSQSPFIFADIELDTHLYDVNVSPDKRTILLHDQTRMLENLKTALTALFESQDYTVPVSQLPAQKQTKYKQLTINRDSTPTERAPQTSLESTEGEESEDSSIPARRGQNTDEGSENSYNSQRRRGAVSREATGRSHEGINLISNWVGRKSDDRVKPKDPAPKVVQEGPQGLSKEKRKLLGKLEREQEQAKIVENSPDPESSVTTTQDSHTSESPQPAGIGDVRELDKGRAQNSQEDNRDASTEPEIRIPSIITSPPKPTPSIMERFTSTGRPHRTPTAMATITIGDHTVISSIGTPCPKRQRTENISSTSCNMDPSLTTRLPSFGNRLSQRFAAPGTTQQSVSSEDETEDEVHDTPVSPVDNIKNFPGDNPVVDAEVAQAASESPDENEQPVDESPPTPENDEDGEYVDEAEKKAQEEAKVQDLIKEAEQPITVSSRDNITRAKFILKGGGKRKDSTVHMIKTIDTTNTQIDHHFRSLEAVLGTYRETVAIKTVDEALDAEEKLSLKISKADFAKMKIIGQFNLGFILASRASRPELTDSMPTADDLFIIDQHASDEKFNFERLQATTIVQSQRLVYPKTLDLTALEEEIVLDNLSALETNGFVVTFDSSGDSPVGQRCQLVSLPLSRETTFSLTDLEELLSLLSENSAGSIPRPSKVRKMFAMRACRSSIMIGKTLTNKQMGRVVRNMGELDKPWNCPHGRPTMRHLCGLGGWDEMGWREGDVDGGSRATDWAAYVKEHRENSVSP
ncbi:hypothetical protein B7494_g595 [Chlorociboria aeruginascens]|nr:hypothetical protein B7494_g595 [Chlorociboria aeruginascens]